jgi:hypothetical protein
MTKSFTNGLVDSRFEHDSCGFGLIAYRRPTAIDCGLELNKCRIHITLHHIT